jgi:hypothetical protein
MSWNIHHLVEWTQQPHIHEALQHISGKQSTSASCSLDVTVSPSSLDLKLGRTLPFNKATRLQYLQCAVTDGDAMSLTCSRFNFALQLLR